MRSVLAMTLLMACLGAVGAQGVDACRYVSTLAPPTGEYHRVELPREALTLDPYGARIRDPGYPADVRVMSVRAGGDTVAVPYVYEGEAAPAVVRTALAVSNPGRVGAAYRYTVEVPGARALSALELTLANRDFDGRVTVEGANRLGDFQTIAEDIRIVGLVAEGQAFEYARLRFPTSRYRYYRLTVGGIADLVLQAVSAYDVHDGERRPSRRYAARFETRTPTRDASATELLVYLEEAGLVDRVTIYVGDTVPYARGLQLRTMMNPEDSAPLAYRDRPTGYASGQLTLEDSTVYVTAAVAEVVSVKIKNGDDRPLRIDSVAVEGPRRFLVARFGAGAASAYLSYGCAERGAADYDLAQLREQIPAQLTTLALGETRVYETGAEAEVPPDWSRIWLWAALLVVGVVILVLGVRLLQ